MSRRTRRRESPRRYHLTASRLHQVGCVGLFATHFHELTALADEVPNVVNKHVSAHVDSNGQLAMLYRLADGPSDQSYGVHVAEAVGFPPALVDEAKRKLRELEGDDDDGGARTEPRKAKQIRRALQSFAEGPAPPAADADAWLDGVAAKVALVGGAA